MLLKSSFYKWKIPGEIFWILVLPPIKFNPDSYVINYAEADIQPIASTQSDLEGKTKISISSPSKSAPYFAITDKGNLIAFVSSIFTRIQVNDSSLNVG